MDRRSLTQLKIRSSNQTINNATHTKVDFDRVNIDVLGEGDTANQRIIVDEDGKYEIFCFVTWVSPSAGKHYLQLYKNGSDIFRRNLNDYNSGRDFVYQSFSYIISLVSGDYVEMWVYQSTGGNETLRENDGYFSIKKIN